MLISPPVGDRELDRIPAGRLFQEDARMNYTDIDHHGQYSHVTLMDEKRPKAIFSLNSEKTGF
jgi:hypothetical protein